ncbi:hemagglutinin repeat-containing protein [Pseudomonas solani]|uniref:hemagglutinin repeat-containing protein n=1 Tax=Pseudomonas solani TaxID=2731552 RepID=UPI003C305A2D
MDIRTPFFQNLATALIGVMFLNPIVSVAADLAVDRAAGGNTTLHQAGNGVPLVNIATPDGSGLSHNRFTDYNVGAQGLILNNVTDRTQATQLGGIVVGNPNLQGRAAGTILNEVTGTNRSQLKGYTEVAGHSARVIVANPHGITCDGCGFINTPRATLSTGKPLFENDRLQGFRVDGGDIAIEGAGLDATNVGQFDLITRSARINAELHAQRLEIVAGRNDVRADDLAATSRGGDDGARPSLAIDSSALGGMYAGAIRLVGTEAGVGVRLAGDMAASAGDLRIDTAGKLTLAQSAAKGDLQVKAQSAELTAAAYAGGSAALETQGDLVVRQSLAAKDAVQLASGGTTVNQGVIEAGVSPDGRRPGGGDVTVRARDVRNTGSLVAGRSLGLQVERILVNQGGTLSARGNARVTAATLDNRQGRVLAEGELALAANELQNSQAGLVSSAGKLEAKLGHLDNRGGELSSQTRADLKVASVDNRSGRIIGQQALRLDASAAVNNQSGSLGAGRQLQLKSGALDNRGGQLTSGATLDLQAGAVDNRDAGRIASEGKLSGSVTALDQRSGGRLFSNSDLSLDLGGGHLNNSGGLLNAPGQLLLTNLGDVSNLGGEISSRQAFTLAARNLDNSGGKLLSAQALNVRVDQALNNLKGLISAAALEAHSASLGNDDGLVTSAGDLLLHVAGHASNRDGEISSGGATRFSASSLDNQGGDLLADIGLALSLTGALDNQGGTLGSRRDLDLQAASLDNRRGTLVADGGLNARVSDLLDNQGQGSLLAKGSLAILTGRLDNRGGEISGQDRVRLDGNHLDNRAGALSATGPLMLKLGQLDNSQQGRITASGALSMEAEAVHNARGRIASQGDLSAVLGSLAQQGGELVTQGNLRLQARTLDNRQGGLVGSTKALELEIGHLDNRGGELSSQSGVKLAGQWLDNSGGKLLAGAGLMLAVERVINQSKGLVFGRETVTLGGSSLDNSDGTLASTGVLAISLAPKVGVAQGELLNRQGLISSDGTLTLQVGRLDNQHGALSSAGDLNLASASLDNSAAGTVSAKGDAQVTTGALNNRQGGRLTASGALELNAGQVSNRDQGRIASGQRLTARVSGLDQRGGGELFSRSDLSLDLHQGLLDNSDGGLINSPGHLLLRNLGQVINRGGEISSQQGFILAAQQLDNGGGQLLSNQTLVLRIAQALDNAKGAIVARRLDLSAGSLDNRLGETTSRESLRADLGTLDQRGGLLLAGGNLELKVSQLDNSANGLISADADLLLAAGEADNRGGEISGQGTVQLSGSHLDNSDNGRLLAGSGLVLAIEHVINRTKGLISSNAGVVLAGASLDNGGGRLLSLQTLDIVLRDALSNSEGLIDSDGRLDLAVGSLDNSGGSLSSAGAMVIDSRGAVVNDKGQLLTDDSLWLSSTSLGNHQGMLSAKGRAQIASGRLDNSQGQLNSAETLDLTTAELVNNAGAIGSHKALNASVSRLEQQGGKLFSDTDLRLDLNGGDLDNRRGLINAPGQLLLNNLGHLDNQGGEVSSQQAFTLAARSLDNGSGKLLSAQALTLRIEQALANFKGLIAGARLDAQAASLANSGGTLTSRGDTRIDTTGALVNDDQGLINAAQRLTLNAGHLDNRDGSLLSGTALELQAQGIDNRDRGLINSQGTLDLQTGTLDSSDDGEVSARGSMLLAIDRLIQRQGRLIGVAGLRLDLNGGDLDNQGGLILTQGPLHISRLRDLANQAGEISSSQGFNLTLRNLDNQGGKLISSGQLVLAGTGLNNQGGLLSGWQGLGVSALSLDNRNLGTLSSRNGNLAVSLTGELLNSAEGALVSQGRLDVKATRLDNSGKGILSSGGDQQLDIANELNNSTGGQIDSGAALNLQAARLSNAAGSLQAQQVLDLRVTDVDNGDGSIASDGAIDLSLLGSFTNANGKLASAGPLLVHGATRIDNQGGQIASQGLLTLLAGHLDNRNRGTLAANGALLLTASGAVQNDNDGLIYSRDAGIRIKSANLGNSLGVIQSQGDLAIDTGTFANLGGRTLSQEGNLAISAGNLDNRGGTLASVQGWVKARLGGWLNNSASAGKAGVIQGRSLELGATSFLNQGGHISALGGDARLASSGNLDNSQGGLYARGLLKVTGNNLSNAGQIAAQRLDFSLAGALDNQQGIIESDSILAIVAASLDNRGGQLRSLGTTGRSQLSVQGLLDNRDGTLEAANSDFGLTAGSFQNAGGALLHVGSGAFDIALANIANAGGSIVTRGGLTLEADSWINSSIIQAGRLTVNVGQFQQTASGQLLASSSFTGSGADWSNDGLIASDGVLSLQLSGTYGGTGRVTSLGDLDLGVAQLTLPTAGRITSGGNAAVKAGSLFANHGVLTSAGGLMLNAGQLDNFGTLGSGEQLRLTTPTLLNEHGLIFSGDDMVLRVMNLKNRFADIYSLGSLSIAADDAGARSAMLENISATLESSKDMNLHVDTLENRRDQFKVERRLVSGSITITGDDFCKGKGCEWYFSAVENYEDFVVAGESSASAFINAGGDLNHSGSMFSNRHSSVSAAGNINIETADLNNVGAGGGEQRRYSAGGYTRHRPYYGAFITNQGLFNQYNNPAYEEYQPGAITLDQVLASVPSGLFHVSDYWIPTSGKVVANAIIQAGGNVTIKASSSLGNGLSLSNVAYSGGASKVSDTSVAASTGGNVVLINAQLPPDLAQKQVNPLSLPGFSIPTGPNGLFRLSSTAASDADATRADQGPPSWSMAGGSIDLAQRERDLSDTQARQVQLAQRGPTGTDQLEAGSRQAVDGTKADRIHVEASGAFPGTVVPERNDVSGGPSQGGAIASTPGDTSNPQKQVIDRVQGLPAVDAQSRPHRYLIETNPELTNLKQFLSSDYLLGLLGYDPDQAQKRLGDGLYEQRLVREAITARTGQRYLAGLGSDEAMFRYLMDNAISSKQSLNLSLGVGLTDAQVAALTHDIVWLEEHEVNGEKVLVPVLYLAQAKGRLAPNGALIQGRDVALISGGELVNQGTLRANNDLAVTAGSIVNSGLMDAASRLDLLATDSIRNAQGGVIAGRDVSAIALKGDLINERSQATLTTQSGTSARQDTVMDSAARIEAANDLSLSAGRDLANIGSVISAGGGASLSAGRDLLIGSATEVDSAEGRGKKSRWSEATITQHGSDLQVGGQLKVEAGRDLTVIASRVEAGGDIAMAAGRDLEIASAANESHYESHSKRKRKQLDIERDSVRQQGSEIVSGGDLKLTAGHDLGLTASRLEASNEAYLYAGNDLSLLAAEESDYASRYSRKKKSGAFSSSTKARYSVDASSEAQGSLVSANNVDLRAQNDMRVHGSDVVSTEHTSLQAGRDIDVRGVTESHYQEHYEQKKKSGLMSSGGIGITLGSSSLKGSQQSGVETTRASTVGSIQGDVSVQAGRALDVTGSDVVAGRDIRLSGQEVTISAAENNNRSEQRQESKKSGLTLALSGAVGAAVNTAYETAQAARDSEQSGDSRMAALQGVKAGLSGYQAWQAAEQGGMTADNAGEFVGISVSLGTQKSSSKQVLEQQVSQGSNVNAGRDLSIQARGAEGQGGDLTVVGSGLKAGRDLTLDAAQDIHLDAAANTQKLTGSNKSGGGNVGISLGVSDSGIGLSIFANANTGLGMEKGSGTTWEEAKLDAGNQVKLSSGRDATLQGAQVSGERIVADIGRDLILQSQQDSDRFDAKQQNVSAGGSFTFGSMTGSGYVSVNQSKLKSRYDSVQEQTGLFAGEGGYQIDVGQHTQLDGAVIGSTADADKNRLSTGTLGWSDIRNKAEFNSQQQSAGISSSGTAGQQFLGNMASGLVSGSNRSGEDSSTTRAAVSEGQIDIRDAENQQQDVAILNRDVEHAHQALSPIFDKEKEQRRLREVQAIAEIGTQVMDIVRTEGQIKATREGKEALERQGIRQPGAGASAEDRDAYQKALVNSQAYKDAMAPYGTGGDYQRAAQAVTAALQGLAGGNISAAVAGAAAPYVAQTIKQATGDNDNARLMAHAVLAAVVAKAQGNSAAAGAAGAVSGELMAELIAKKLYSDIPVKDLSEEQKQTVSALSTLAAGLAGAALDGDAANAVAGAQGGRNAVENNALGMAGGDIGFWLSKPDGCDTDCKAGIAQQTAEGGMKVSGALVAAAVGGAVTAAALSAARAGAAACAINPAACMAEASIWLGEVAVGDALPTGLVVGAGAKLTFEQAAEIRALMEVERQTGHKFSAAAVETFLANSSAKPVESALGAGPKEITKVNPPLALPSGKQGSVIRGSLTDHEFKQASEIVSFKGGEFKGVDSSKFAGIDGWLDGVPVQLKVVEGASINAVRRNIISGAKDMAKAGYRGDLYIDASKTGVSMSKMLDHFKPGSPVSNVVGEGVVGNIYIKTQDGWMSISAGRVAQHKGWQ